MNTLKPYPLGIQDFSEIINQNMLYVDKTAYVYRMTRPGSKYVFLSRSRRFGKSLLVSTLAEYLSGHAGLFKGLAIENLEKEWTRHPVLRFDMSTAKHMSKETLIQEIEEKLSGYEKIYPRDSAHININQRMEGLIKHAAAVSGAKRERTVARSSSAKMFL